MPSPAFHIPPAYKPFHTPFDTLLNATTFEKFYHKGSTHTDYIFLHYVPSCTPLTCMYIVYVNGNPHIFISSFVTILSLQPTLYHNSATARNSSSVCTLYLGHSMQLSPHKVIFSSIKLPFYITNTLSFFRLIFRTRKKTHKRYSYTYFTTYKSCQICQNYATYK